MTPEIAKSLDQLRAIWNPEASCITCKNWTSNYMTPHGFGQCAHLPKWQSTSPHSHCTKHAAADNIPARMAWLEKQGMK